MNTGTKGLSDAILCGHARTFISVFGKRPAILNQIIMISVVLHIDLQCRLRPATKEAYPVANSGKIGPNPSLYSVNHVILCVCACVNGRACSSSFLQSMKENLMP